MEKNCQRKMIILKNPNSRFFDEAYLILKDSLDEEQAESADILEEANKLLASRIVEVDERKRHRPWLCFGLGMASTALPVGLIYFLFLR